MARAAPLLWQRALRGMQTPDQLFEATAQAMLAGVDRDAIAGWGGVVYLITLDGVTARTLKGRMD